MELAAFMPSWAEEAQSIAIFPTPHKCTFAFCSRVQGPSPEEEVGEEGAGKKRRRMDMIAWSLAFDNMAIAFDAIEALRFASAMAHKRVCLMIACEPPPLGHLRP